MICLPRSRRELSKCVSAKSRFFDTFTDFFLTYAGVLAAVRVPLCPRAPLIFSPAPAAVRPCYLPTCCLTPAAMSWHTAFPVKQKS